MNGLSEKYKTLASELGYDGFFKLKRHTIQYEKFDGSLSHVHKREVLVRAPTVAVLMFDEAKRSVLLTEQFRVGPLENNEDPWLYELPAGIIEKGEQVEKAAQREVLEETGYQCQINSNLGTFYLSPGGSNETTTLLAANLNLDESGQHGAHGENEDIRTHIVPLTEAYKLMESGKCSAITAIALMWFKAKVALNS